MSEKNSMPNNAKAPLCYSSEEARTVLDSLSAHIAILDENGIVLDTNRAWRNFAVKSGMPADYDSIGDNYLEICDASTGEDGDYARAVAAGILDVIDGRAAEFLLDYPCHSSDGRHWYYVRVLRMSGEGPIRVVVSHEEITALKLTEEALRESQARLTEQKVELEEANIALKVLLKQREDDKGDLEQKVITNVKEMVLPYVEKLKNAPLKAREKTLVEIVESHLNDIVSPLLRRLTSAQLVLTPQEIQVAALVKEGKGSKEIADILNVSATTIAFHRKNLRKKFNLSNTRQNLRAFLLSLS